MWAIIAIAYCFLSKSRFERKRAESPTRVMRPVSASSPLSNPRPLASIAATSNHHYYWQQMLLRERHPFGRLGFTPPNSLPKATHLKTTDPKQVPRQLWDNTPALRQPSAVTVRPASASVYAQVYSSSPEFRPGGSMIAAPAFKPLNLGGSNRPFAGQAGRAMRGSARVIAQPRAR